MEVTHDAGDQGAAPAEAAEATPGIDLSPVLEHVNKLGESLGGRLDGLEQRLPAEEQQQYARDDLGRFAGQDPYAQQQPGFPQPGMQPGMAPGMYDEYGELTEQGMQAQLQQMVGPLLTPLQQQQQQLAEQNARLMEQLQSVETDRSADYILGKYPEFQDEAEQQKLTDFGQNLAQQMGSPDLVGQTGFWETAIKLMRAEAAAAGETPATPSPSLEPAGGGTLAANEPSPQERIKAAGGTNPLWGV